MKFLHTAPQTLAHDSPPETPRHPALRPARSAFTLIEILVSVTILTIMVLLTVRIIANATDIIGTTTRRASQNMGARVVMDMLTRDFMQAVGSSNYCFFWGDAPLAGVVGAFNDPTYDIYKHEGIKFVGFTGQPDIDYREAEMICYFLKESTTDQENAKGFSFYRLMRSSISIKTGSGNNKSDWGSSIPESEQVELIPYVVSLSFNCCTNDLSTPNVSIAKGIEHNTLPAYMDVFLTVLSEQDARRAARLGDPSFDPTEQKAFIAKNARRYYTRCFSLNRTAYSGGR